jgi:hypothetical protein
VRHAISIGHEVAELYDHFPGAMGARDTIAEKTTADGGLFMSCDLLLCSVL